MPTYCEDADVTQFLPGSNLPTAVDTSAERATRITSASSMVDSMVGPRFALGYASGTQKFPDVTDSPATPEIIQLVTGMLSAWLVRNAMNATNRTGSDPTPLWDEAKRILDAIASGDITVSVSGTALGALAGIEVTNADNTEPAFSQGDYDADGTLLSDNAGTLDDF